MMSATMFGHYFALALRSLCHRIGITMLMIVAIAVGIGASMTVLSVFRAMSGDPIPHKSGQLYVPQIDSWGPGGRQSSSATRPDNLQDTLTYIDAMALMQARAGKRQAAMFRTALTLVPEDPQLLPFGVDVRATYGDFFAMFAVPFLYGGAWNSVDDESRNATVVITRKLNDRLFGGANSIGRTIQMNHRHYRVVGVLKDWRPVPRFYDVVTSRYGETEQVFVPFTLAVQERMTVLGGTNCNKDSPGGEAFLQSDCVWVRFWVELPSAAEERAYSQFLNSYAAEQRSAGRFPWPPRSQLRNVREWLVYQHVVTDEMRVMVLVSFSFLFVCLLNAMGLMLAKIVGRASDIATRRALGASRREIFAQYLVEPCVIGVAGGLLGILLTWLGLLSVRKLFSTQILELTRLEPANVMIALSLSVAGALLAGLYPAWRATGAQWAAELKGH